VEEIDDLVDRHPVGPWTPRRGHGAASMGQERATNFSTFHQALNRARWSPLAVSRQLLTMIVETFVQAGGTLELVIDETLERRWGPKISKRGHYRDSALSSRKRSVSSPGLRWIVMAVVVTLPWTTQRYALPFLCVLATTPEVSATLGKPHKTVGMWACQMVKLVHRWCPTLPITLLGDTAYSILELGLVCQEQEVSLITPFHLDAALHELPHATPTPWPSAGSWLASPLARTDPGRSGHDVAAPHPGLVWARGTDPGDLHRDRLVVSSRLRPCAHSLGAHP